MARRKSRLERYTPIELVPEAIMDIVLGKKKALEKYAYKYTASNPKKMAWLMFMIEKLEERKSEWEPLKGKERSAKIQDLISEIAKEWKDMPEEAKAKYYERAEEWLKTWQSMVKKQIEAGKEIEKTVKDAYKGLIELVAEV